MSQVILVLLILLSILALGLLWGLVEAHCLTLKQIVINLPETPQTLQQLCQKRQNPFLPPPALSDFYQDWGSQTPPSPLADRQRVRVVWLTDLHLRPGSIGLNRVLALLKTHDFDLCLIGGDLAHGARNREYALAQLSQLADHLKTRGIACYSVQGNHDKPFSPADLKAAGFPRLDNQWVRLTLDPGRTVHLLGLEDLRIGQPTWPSSAQWQHTPRLRLVIGHNPDLIDQLDPAQFDCFLCGHFHGGQIRVPGKIELRWMRPERLAQAGLREGVFAYQGALGYLGRGLGCVLLPLRFFCPPQVTLLHFDYPASP